MKRLTKPLLLGSAAVLMLAACDPAYQTQDYERTRQGASIGAALGALAGAAGEDGGDAVRGAATGAAIGAVVGGGVGNILDRQARDLRNNLGNSQIDVVNTGSELIVRMPQDILFDVDSASVRPGLQSDLGVLAANLQQYPNSSVRVVGHTDNTGPAAYNQDLSERRALAVTRTLQGQGVTGGRLQAVGAGEDQPLASNLTPEGRAQNRRVDIVIVPYN